MNTQNTAYLKRHIDILSFRDLSQHTIDTYTSYMTQFIDWTESEFPGKQIPELSVDELRSYFLHLKNIRCLNPRTINVHIAQLRDFYQYVLRVNWDRYQLPFMKYDTSLPKVPSKNEVNALIDSIENPKHKAERALLYSSGIRVSELVRLKCCDIHRKEGLIYISVSKNRCDRYAVLSKKAFYLLAMYIHLCYCEAKPDDWLFPGSREGTHINTQTVRNIFNRQVEVLGLADKGYVLHSLRHAFGLHLYERTHDLILVKEAMGHKSVTSSEVYVALGLGNGRNLVSPYDY